MINDRRIITPQNDEFMIGLLPPEVRERALALLRTVRNKIKNGGHSPHPILKVERLISEYERFVDSPQDKTQAI